MDLNSATVEQLLRVPGIGPKTASVIVNFRQKEWAVSEDLLAINGISKGKLEEVRPYVTVIAPPLQNLTGHRSEVRESMWSARACSRFFLDQAGLALNALRDES